MSEGAEARDTRRALSAAVNLEFAAICGIVLVSVLAFAGLIGGVLVAVLAHDHTTRVLAGIGAGVSVLAWPLTSLPCYIGVAVARYLRLRASSER